MEGKTFRVYWNVIHHYRYQHSTGHFFSNPFFFFFFFFKISKDNFVFPVTKHFHHLRTLKLSTFSRFPLFAFRNRRRLVESFFLHFFFFPFLFFSNARVCVVSRPTLDALPVHFFFASRGPHTKFSVLGRFCRRGPPKGRRGGI